MCFISVDFPERGLPETQNIPSLDSNQHLKPILDLMSLTGNWSASKTQWKVLLCASAIRECLANI